MSSIKCTTKIAILMGVYNAELYICQQIDSIISQTYCDWTLYIRDDASSDNTLSIIKQYVSKYKQICLIEDECGNLGCNGNYFKLLSLVSSEYYMFCNADDIWLENKIKDTYHLYKQTEKKYGNNIPIIVHTDLIISDSELNITSSSYWDSYNVQPRLSNTRKYIGISNAVAGATMLFNNLVKNITFPVCGERPFFDHWMAIKTLQCQGIIEPLYMPTMIYRQIGSNLAAVGEQNQKTISYKLTHLRQIIDVNLNEAKILRNIGWGGLVKYFFIKMQFIIVDKYYSIIRKQKIHNENTFPLR